MTVPQRDDELIKLLESKSPHELSIAEIHWLRQRMQQSQEVRKVLLEQLRMETYLATALSRIHITPEMILSRAPRQPAVRTHRLAIFAVSAGVLVLVVGYGIVRSRRPQSDRSSMVAEGTGIDERSRRAVVDRRSKAGKREEKATDAAVPTNPANQQGDPSTDRTRAASSAGADDHSDHAATDASADGGPAVNEPDSSLPLKQPEEPELPDPVRESVAPQAPVPPWHDALVDDRPLPPFEQVCFDTFETGKFLPRREYLEKWFEPLDGNPQRIVDARTTVGQCAGIDGVLRLKAPLGPHHGLRVWMENYQRLQIQLYRGREGVALVYHEDDNWRWSAYRIERESTAAAPGAWMLLATDDGRARRTNLRLGGPIEIRPAHGEVLVTRGDVVLLRAPFPGAIPDEVLFSGKATFYGIAMVHSAPPPALREDGPVQPRALRPAESDWTEQLGTNARLERMPGGEVQLHAEMAAVRGWAMMPLPNGELREVVLKIEQAGSGAGVFLGKPGERPGQVVRWMQDRRNGGLCLAVRGDEDAREDNYPSVAEHYLPVNSGSHWLRLVVGSGVARCWTGSDGVHWAELEQTLPVPLGATHLGLHHVAMSSGCGLRLVHCEIRPLDALTAMVPDTVLKKAPPVLDAITREAWLQQVDPSRPSDVELSVWRRAAALRTLAAGCTRVIGEPLLLDLLADLPQLEWPVDLQLRALEQASLLLDLRNTHAVVPLLVERYQQLGQAMFRAGAQLPCSDIRPAFMHLPLDTKANYPLVDPQLVRLELLTYLYRGAWDDAFDFCRRVRFFHHQENVPLLDWGESLARRASLSGERVSRRLAAQRSEPRASRVRGVESALRPKPGWQHPLIEELDKDTYNALGELQAILESGSADEAARLIATLSVDATRGLARWGGDDSLLVTMPVAVLHAIRSSPALREAIIRNHAAIARVRIREAIAAGDAAAVRLAAVQFEPTEFAVEARQWLGDRALADGQFDLALGEYQRAARSLSEIPESLSARLRLAGAMLGLHLDVGFAADVKIGERRWSAGEFDAMLTELRRHRGIDAAKSAAAPAGAVAGVPGERHPPFQDRYAVDARGDGSELRLQTAPSPGNFQVQVRGAIDGPLGEAPGEEVMRGLNRFKVDWAGNQIAALTDDKSLFVSNRFQVAAYHVETGQRLWQAAPQGVKALRSRDWTNVPMRPVPLGNALVARMLYGDGPILMSVEKATGRLLWAASDWKGQWVVSDPIPRHDRLLALTLQRLDPTESILKLTSIDAETGDILTQVDLLRLSPTWLTHRMCELLPRDDGLIAVLGGMVLCCDYDGEVRWLRHQVALPFDEESETCAQSHDRPLLHEGWLCYAQPGVRTVDCVDAATGQLRWSTLVPDIRRMVAWRAGVVVVQTDAGFSGLNETDGHVVWATRVAGVLTMQMDGPPAEVARVPGNSATILISRTLPVDGAKKFRPQLDWLDVTTGAVQASVALPALDDEDPRWGPAIAGPGRTWVFFGRGPQDPRRELVELVRQP